MDKVQLLDFEVSSSHVLYIPPYWWYSIQYDGVSSGVIEYTYSTLINRIAYIGDVGRHWLQQQNIVSKATKTKTLHKKSSIHNNDDLNEDIENIEEIKDNNIIPEDE